MASGRTRLRRFVRRVKRRGMARRRGMRRARLLYNPSPTFTETINLTTLNTGTTAAGNAGLIAVAMNEIPQYTDYQALYNQYCLRKVTLIFVPSYDQYDSNNAASATTSAVTAPRFVYSINDSAKQTPPSTELDVLSDNGAKIRMLDKPIKVRFTPVAQVKLTDSNSNLVSETRKNRWFSFDDVGVAHSGVAWAITQTVLNSTAQQPACVVYAKITFSLRDPK